jgi:ABC-type Fe3+-hydroxamate transport system substrate-binding protein
MSGGNGRSTLLVFTRAPERVVSLVPSMTDTLLEFGVGHTLVGVTDYCRLPAELEGQVARVGGTRTADSAAIRSLSPDVVLANQEENLRELVEDLEAAGLRVWVTFPRSVRGAMDVMWLVIELFRLAQAAPKMHVLEATLEWTMCASEGSERPRVFCPIWQDRTPDGEPWWMTFSAGAYAHDVLRVCGGDNAFAERPRKYPLEADLGLAQDEDPGGRDTRYPCVRLREVVAAQPDVILLPDEPFHFDDAHEAQVREALSATPAVKAGRVHRVDGTLVAWHGTRLGKALAELPLLLQSR